MSKIIELTTKNFKEASKINGKEEFCFIIGDHEIYCHSFVAAFISRTVLSFILTDPTINTFNFVKTTKHEEGKYVNELSQLLSQTITKGYFELEKTKIDQIIDEIETLQNSTKYENTLLYSYLLFIEELNNDEIRQKFHSIIFSQILKNNGQENENKNKENQTNDKEYKYNIQQQLIKLNKIEKIEEIIENIRSQKVNYIIDENNLFKELFEQEYSSFIDDIAGHFYELDEETIINVKSRILNDILNSKNLKIKDEDSLLQILLNRRKSFIQNQQNKNVDENVKNEFFLEKVHYEFLSEESIKNFVNEISFYDLNNDLWESVSRRLILPFENQNKNERSFKQPKPKIEFPYKDDEQFKGILKHLSEITNGNIQTNKTIEIKCSKLCCGNLESLVDFNNSQGAAHVNGSPTPRWLQIDFKTRKIQINSYLIKKKL